MLRNYSSSHLYITDFETDCGEWLTWMNTTKWVDRIYFFRVRCTSFHIHSPILTFFLCFTVLFQSCCPMRKCLGKHSCMSSRPFALAILNGTCSVRALILFCGDVPAIKELNYKLYKKRYNYFTVTIVRTIPDLIAVANPGGPQSRTRKRHRYRYSHPSKEGVCKDFRPEQEEVMKPLCVICCYCSILNLWEVVSCCKLCFSEIGC